MNLRLGTLLIAALLLASGLVNAEESANPHLFRSVTANFEVHIPTGWHFQSIQSALDNRASVKLKDEEFEKFIQQMSSAPLIVATKFEEPYETLNPSFQVLARPLGPLAGKTGIEILQIVVPAIQAQFQDFEIINEIHETEVAGNSAGRATVRYTLVTQDAREYPTEATLVLIPRGKVLYQLGFSGPPDGADALGSEIESTLSTVGFLE